MTGWAIVLAVAGAGCYALEALWQNRTVQDSNFARTRATRDHRQP